MTRNFHRPLPRRKQSKNRAAVDGPSRKYNPAKNGLPNVIDGDGTGISAGDSALAVARRTDASGAIEDPPFIVGTSPHPRGVDPGGSGGLADGKGGGRDGGLGGPYARDRDRGCTVVGGRGRIGNGGDGSVERNPARGELGRPAGRPREGFRGSSIPDDEGRARSRYGGGRPSDPGPYFPDPGPPKRNANGGRQRQRSSSGSRGRRTSETNPFVSGRPEPSANGGVGFAERGRRRASDPGLAEVNAKGKVRFAEREWRRAPDREPPEVNANGGVGFAERGRHQISDPGPPESSTTGGVRFPEKGRRRASKGEVGLEERARRRASDPEPPELNLKRRVRFAERAKRRVYAPDREGGDPPTSRERNARGPAGPDPARQGDEPPATDRMPKKTPSGASGGIVGAKKANAPSRMSRVAVGRGSDEKASTGRASLPSPPPMPPMTAMLALLNGRARRSDDRAPSRTSRPKVRTCPLARWRAWLKTKASRLEEEPRRRGAEVAETKRE